MNHQFQKTASSQTVIYRTKDGKDRIDVRLQDETVRLTQDFIARFFQTAPQDINVHIQSIYKEKEPPETTTCKEYLQVRFEGKRSIQSNLKLFDTQGDLKI